MRPSRAFPLAADLDAAVSRAMGVGVSPGLGVAVYSRDGVYTRGFGVTDVGANERVSADTAFYIASSTKPLTALALATLHQRGVLNLDDPLAAFAPDAAFPAETRANEVRLRNLLSHTGGIANNPLGYRVAFTGQHDPETLWRLLAISSVNAEAPLGTFDYTNVGYNIATVLTDRRLGVAWQDLLQREVFAPAGMVRSSARMSRATDWAVAKPHILTPEKALARIYLEKTDQTMQSAGGVIMSANDAARWLELMVADGRIGGRQVISPEVIAATREPLAAVGAEQEGYQRDNYGLGWHMGPYREERLYHHFGGFAGFAAHVSYMPARGVGVAVFNNNNVVGTGVTHAIANYVYDKTDGHADAEQRFTTALDEAAAMRDRIAERVAADRANRAARPWTLTRPRAAYAGAYENEAWGRIEIAAEGEALNLRFGVLRATATAYTRPDSLRVEFVPGSGAGIDFGGEEPVPPALTFQEAVFRRL